ncbi:MAG: DUF1501 domain-containing protein [Chloroflexota bacterium]|nr:DUF1501 domain-containing protein [Chloroflexota bacterium]
MTTSIARPPVLVVIQLAGGLDFLNTVIPFQSGIIRDARPTVAVPAEETLPLNNELAWHPAVAPLKELYDDGKVAVIQGAGWQHQGGPGADRSHFRATDIWHTCTPDKISTEGWLGKLTREFDPQSQNPVTAVNFGLGLPRALAAPGVTVTSVDSLDRFGLMTEIELEQERAKDLDSFKRMYTPAVGTAMVQEYLAQTGLSVLQSAEILADAPEQYASEVEYGSSPTAQALRDVVRVHTAGLGARIFYTLQRGYDTHSGQNDQLPVLLSQLSEAIRDFIQDLRNHKASEEVTILVFTEFGRRIRDNGSGTDHGSGGGAYLIGDGVRGGLYGEYPSLDPNDWLYGEDLSHTIDFRSIYSTVLDQWLGVDPTEIVGGRFEQIRPYREPIGVG